MSFALTIGASGEVVIGVSVSPNSLRKHNGKYVMSQWLITYGELWRTGISNREKQPTESPGAGWIPCFLKGNSQWSVLSPFSPLFVREYFMLLLTWPDHSSPDMLPDLGGGYIHNQEVYRYIKHSINYALKICTTYYI